MSGWQAYWRSFSGKRVALLGLARSNLPLIEPLQQAGAELVLLDKSEDDRPELDNWKRSGFELHLGKDYLQFQADVVFRTPGIRPDAGCLPALAATGTVLTSEMEAFFQLCPCPIVGVTGSDGKSTTTSLIAAMLKAAGHRVFLGGNLGHPLLSRVPQIESGDIAVVELSSFQLMTMRRSPEVAVVTNLSPNHLNWHTDYAEYIDAKKNIFLHQKLEDTVVLNADCCETASLSAQARGNLLWFSRCAEANACLRGPDLLYNGAFVMKADELQLPGRHFLEDLCAAVAAAGRWASPKAMRGAAAAFGGVEHRLEWVGKFGGVSYYNDSIATSPNRAVAGLNAFDRKVILIAGGKDKGIPFTQLAQALPLCAKEVIVTGEALGAILEAAQAVAGCPPIHRADNMAAAVGLAASLASDGDIVLLSPACTAFDAYPDFEVRGRHFKTLVREMYA